MSVIICEDCSEFDIFGGHLVPGTGLNVPKMACKQCGGS